MHLSRTQRKFILLYARLIELYRTQERVEGGHIQLGGSPKGFYWRDDAGHEREIVELDYLKTHRTAAAPRPPEEDKAPHGSNRLPLQCLDDIIPFLFPARWLPSPVSNDRQGVFSFGENIGLSRGRARYMIDQEYARQVPTYSFATQSKKDAERFTAAHGGLYLLYRHDVNSVTRKAGDAQGLLVRAAISIRYPVPYSSRDTRNQGLRRVRCKVNLPSYNEARPALLYKYDGYVVPQRERWCWLLQARPVRDDSDISDLILMYTNTPTSRADGTPYPIQGVMMTQSQDGLVPTISKVVLFRLPGVKVQDTPVPQTVQHEVPEADLPKYLGAYQSMEPNDERSFMRSAPATIDLADRATWNLKEGEIDWDYQDAEAIKLLFQGGAPLNSDGLHE